MGLFLQTLHIAAAQAGYTNYLDAVFLLQVDFVELQMGQMKCICLNWQNLP